MQRTWQNGAPSCPSPTCGAHHTGPRNRLDRGRMVSATRQQYAHGASGIYLSHGLVPVEIAQEGATVAPATIALMQKYPRGDRLMQKDPRGDEVLFDTRGGRGTGVACENLHASVNTMVPARKHNHCCPPVATAATSILRSLRQPSLPL